MFRHIKGYINHRLILVYVYCTVVLYIKMHQLKFKQYTVIKSFNLWGLIYTVLHLHLMYKL